MSPQANFALAVSARISSRCESGLNSLPRLYKNNRSSEMIRQLAEKFALVLAMRLFLS